MVQGAELESQENGLKYNNNACNTYPETKFFVDDILSCFYAINIYSVVSLCS